MSSKMFLKRAFDANAFITSDAEAIKVNPKIWDTRLREAVDKKIIYAAVGTQYEDFKKPGRDLTITVDVAGDEAADLTETNGVAIVAMSNRQVTFTPSERGVGYEVSKSELEDAFFDVMPKMVQKVASGLAKKIDSDGVSAALAAATTSYNVGEVADASMDDTSVLTLSEFTKAVRIIKNKYYNPTEAFINPFQEEQILNITQLQKSNEFGSRDAILSGFVGQLFGVKIYVSHSIPVEAAAGSFTVDTAQMIFQGTHDSGEKAMGYAVKRDPTIETDYHAKERRYEVLGTARYDFQALHPDAIVAVRSYAA